MANYSDIRGYRVKYLSSDPTLNTSTEGQVWYNSTSGTLKALVKVAAFSSGSPLNTARAITTGAGTTAAGLVAGGAEPANSNKTEEYNGSGWTVGGTMGTARPNNAGTGTQTAAVTFGGNPSAVTNATEEYDGSTWTAGGNMANAGRNRSSGIGIQTAALGAGNYQPGTSTNTEEYDGSTWSAGGALGTAQYGSAGAGSQTAGLLIGGINPPSSRTYSAEYDGSTWTVGSPLNGPSAFRCGGGGTQTDAIAMAVSNGSSNIRAENYDGTTWSISPATMTSTRSDVGAGVKGGPAGDTFVAGGNAPGGVSSLTEEFDNSINSVTAAAWSSGATQPVARQDVASFGTSRSAGIMFAGGLSPGSPGYSANALTYDGTWTANPSLNTARGLTQGFGTIAAGNVAGGWTGSASTASENWNGSTWTTTGSLTVARSNSTAFGTQTAGVVAGSSVAPLEAVQHFDGSTWTAATALPTPTTASYSRGCGTQTAGLWIRQADAYEYDGSAWTASNPLNTARIAGSMAGIQTNALYGTGSKVPNTEAYDGTTWRTDANVAVEATRTTSGPAGDSSSLVRASGENTPSGNHLTSVEDYNPETSVATASTLTTS